MSAAQRMHLDWRRGTALLGSVGVIATTVGLLIYLHEGRLWLWPTALAVAAAPVATLLYGMRERHPGAFPAWASRLLDLAARMIPVVAWIAGQQRLKEQNRSLLENFDAMLAAYRLPPLGGVVSAAAGRLLRVELVAEKYSKVEGSPDSLTLTLLYRERYGLPRLNLWLSHHQALAETVAAVVAEGQRLPHREEGFPHTPAHLQRLLLRLRTFSVDLLAGTLRLLGEQWRRVQRYEQFLEVNGVSGVPLTADAMLHHVEANRGLPVDAETLYRLRDPSLSLHLLEKCENPATGESLRLVYRGLFLAEADFDAQRLIERVCRQIVAPRAADQAALTPDPVEVLLAYLIRKDHGSLAVPIDLTRWRTWVAAAPPATLATELNRLRGDLQGGWWPTTRKQIGLASERVPTTAEAGFGALDKSVEQVPDLTVEALTPLLRDLVRDSVTFAQTFHATSHLDAYLLTFDSVEGHLAPVIDCLADPAYETALERLGVSFRTADGGQVYNFGRFTARTRLGFSPTSTHRAFYDQLRRDLDIVIHDAAELFPGEHAGDPAKVDPARWREVELTLNRVDLWNSRYITLDPKTMFRSPSIRDVYGEVRSKAHLSPAEDEELREVVDHVTR